ncbi:hypothetical protein C8J42_11729 [Sphingomonas sp. PP-CE-1A-559]|uniref:DUF6615 family protein n=1 Tax=Sphingomonas sp. PP-CE-1A-559 TaxID=2135657 RepID=UPI0010543145|nr:DUF6615 family protein [Sphingomonas sp. PP-CE-1A-559]TCP84188.1 hypothetical protein C8J42_11729 [Sphingomonas sp. PP-CE-1A-559]
MAIAPIFASSCDLAQRLPVMIAEFLDIEQKLKRRFREDSVTDILVASLLSLPGNSVVVLTPPESKTGGDFDLVVVDPLSGDAVQFRIQAKRLTPHKHNWEIGSYAELAHPHNSGAQSQTLLRGLGKEAITTIPLYAFYNPAHVGTASGGTVSGIELASAWEIRERIKAIVKVKPKRLPYKRIGSLQPLFFPLSTILCTPATRPRDSDIPKPADARQAVVDAIEARSGLAGFGQTLALPEVTARALPRASATADREGRQRQRSALGSDDRRDGLPAIIRRAVERRSERIITARVKRPKVVLIAD